MVIRVIGSTYPPTTSIATKAERDAMRIESNQTAPKPDMLSGTRDAVSGVGQTPLHGREDLVKKVDKDIQIARGRILNSTTVSQVVTEQKTPRQLPLEVSWKRAMKR